MNMTRIYYDEAKRSRPDIFRGEIAACEHLVQIYQDEGVFMDSLEAFVAGGLKRGDSVIRFCRKL